MNARFAAFALMLGNLVTALAILGPAGMLAQIADGFAVSIGDAGMLVTAGAVVLCLGSPLMAWATSTLPRRQSLAAAVAAMAVGHVVSAFAPSFFALAVIRVAMLIVGAVYTPLAASTISLLVPEKQRPSAIAFIFLGWSLAIAAGLPIVTFVAVNFGWRASYGMLGAAGAVSFVLLAISVPAGLRGAPLSMRSWGEIARNRLIGLLLAITILWTCGQFVLFPYLGPLIAHLADGGPHAIGAAFAAMGVMGFIGNVSATRAVNLFGPFATSLFFLSAMVVGTALWAFGAGLLPAMIGGTAVWGLGFAAFNSMQQARLVAAAPALASATVALNTSANYVGQAIGSALGGTLYEAGALVRMGHVAAACMLLAFGMLLLTRPRR